MTGEVPPKDFDKNPHGAEAAPDVPEDRDQATHKLAEAIAFLESLGYRITAPDRLRTIPPVDLKTSEP